MGAETCLGVGQRREGKAWRGTPPVPEIQVLSGQSYGAVPLTGLKPRTVCDGERPQRWITGLEASCSLCPCHLHSREGPPSYPHPWAVAAGSPRVPGVLERQVYPLMGIVLDTFVAVLRTLTQRCFGNHEARCRSESKTSRKYVPGLEAASHTPAGPSAP